MSLLPRENEDSHNIETGMAMEILAMGIERFMSVLVRLREDFDKNMTRRDIWQLMLQLAAPDDSPAFFVDEEDKENV